mmetsp:Transcript_21790/g.42883  ORF Transcript_21790/g.42883 Transcript_21790/m.42883 type:complete len:372 (-) Transcript_21790:134-1249(-)
MAALLTPLPRIIILDGSANSDQPSLAAALTERYHNLLPLDHPLEYLPGCEGKNKDQSIGKVWQIDTKYYTATTRVETFNPQDAVASSQDEFWWEGVQAVIFAIDMTKPSECIQAYTSLLERAEDIDTFVCVGLVAGATHSEIVGTATKTLSVVESLLEDVDPSIEFIPVKLENYLNKSASLERDSDGSKLGLDRLAEVLETTMWSNMQPKTLSNTTTSETLSQENMQLSWNESNSSLSSAPSFSHEAEGRSCDASEDSGSCMVKCPVDTIVEAPSVDASCHNKSSFQLANSTNEPEDIALVATAAAAMKTDSNIDDLAILMDEVRRVKSLHGTRSRDQHVQEATLIAMRLAAALGLDGDSDDESVEDTNDI